MIRKPIAALIFFLHITGVLLSQETTKRTHFGVSFTPQLSFPIFKSSDLQQYEPGFGFMLGGDMYLDLSSKFQARTGLNFQHANIIYRDYSPLFPEDVVNGAADIYKSYWDFNFTNFFIGLPLEVKLKLAKPQATNHLFITSSTQVRFLVGSSGEITLVESGKVNHSYAPDSAIFNRNKTWIYFSAGIGYEFKIGNGKAVIHPIYEYSPTKFFKEDAAAIANGNPAFIGIRLAYY